MFDQINLGPKLLDTVTGGTISWIEKKIRTTAAFQKIEHKFNPEDLPSEIKELLDKSVNMAKDGLTEIDKTILRENLECNKEVILKWITAPDDLKMTKELEHIELLYPESRKILERFFKKLFLQILSNRDDYNLILSLQMKSEIKSIKNNQGLMLNNQDLMINGIGQIKSLLADMSITKESWNFAKTLDKIEKYIISRNSKDAIRIALSVEEEILKNNDSEEIEKLYQLIVNAYLQETENQNLAIEPLEKLINFTSNVEKKTQREILLSIIKKDFVIAEEKIKQYEYTRFEDKGVVKKIHNLKLNLFFLRKDYTNAIIFLNSIKEEYCDYLYWLCQIYLVLEDTQAYELLKQNTVYFSNEKFAIKKLKFEILLTQYVNEVNAGINIENNLLKLKQLTFDVDELIDDSGDDNIIKSTLICQKAYILGMLNELEAADAEYIKAENIEAYNPLLLRNYPILLSSSQNKRKTQKAIKLLSIYLKDNPEDFLAMGLYFNILVKDDVVKAISELEDLVKVGKIPLRIQIILVEAYDLNYKKSNADNFLSKLEIDHPNTPLISYAKGKRNKSRNIDTAIINYETAITNSLEEPYLLLAITDLVKICLNKNTKYFLEKAIKLIEGRYNQDFIIYNFSELYLECYFRLKEYIKCIELCGIIEKIDPQNNHVFRIKCFCYYETENYGLAIESFDKLKEIGQFKNDDLYLYTRCFISIGRIREAEEIIPYITSPQEASDYFNITQFYFIIGKDDLAISTISQGFSKFPAERNIMELFIKIVMQYRISPLGESIKSNFHKCLDNYEKANFKNKIIHSFKFSEDIGPEQLLNELNKFVGEENTRDLFLPQKTFEEIQTKKLPLSFLKGINNRNYLYIWYESLSNPSTLFWIAHGNDNDDTEREIVVFDGIYIDISSLLLIHYLNLQDYLTQNFKTIYVTQSIFDEIQSILLDKKNVLIGSSYLDLSKKDQIKYIQYSSSFYSEIWALADSILETIKTNPHVFKIVGTPLSIVNESSELFDNLSSNEMIKFDTECLRFSYQQNIPIMYDNLTLRVIYNNIGNSPGSFGIVTLIQKLIQDGNFNSNYYSIISKLICLNYNYFRINKDLFIFNLLHEGYCINRRTETVFNLISSEIYNKKDIERITIQVLAFIWIQSLPMEIKEKWTIYIEEVITSRNDFEHLDIIIYLYGILQRLINIQSKKSLEDTISQLLKKYHITKP